MAAFKRPDTVTGWILAGAWRAGLVAGIVMAFLGLVTLVMINIPLDRQKLWSDEREPSYTVVDARGRTVAIRGTLYGDTVPVADLPEHLVKAFLAIEDHRFYEHGGIDPWGLGRAVLVNMQAGRMVQGGSTITQQLAKNLFLSNERTLTRKASELVQALRLENQLPKDEILGLYLNRIYLGAGTYGVDAASRFYFGKEVEEVTLAEAAMLAGLPKAPSRYAPTADLERAQSRARLVLANMRRLEYITPEEEQDARDNPAEPIARPGTDNMGFFVDAIIDRAGKFIDQPKADLLIETTLDITLQKRAEDAALAVMDAKAEELEAEQAAIVSMDHDGGIVAMVGGRSYAKSQFNRAYMARRQPGSAFKPFIYLTALENGVSHRDVVFDEPVKVGDWTPQNYGNVYRGRMTVSEALEKSVNTVAVQLSERMGREKVIAAAHRLGIDTDLENHRAIALGTAEVSLFELTSAYGTFARNGLNIDPYMIRRIIRPDTGEVLYERSPSRPVRLIDRQVAQTMTHMLHQTVRRGTGRSAQIPVHPAAGKTGTSQDYRDAWFVGYTGHYVTGVWVGNDDSRSMKGVTGADLPAQIWRDYMTTAHEGKSLKPMPGAFPADPVDFANPEMVQFLERLATRLDAVRDGRTAFAYDERIEDTFRETEPEEDRQRPDYAYARTRDREDEDAYGRRARGNEQDGWDTDRYDPDRARRRSRDDDPWWKFWR